jgi:hypothetical protein
MITPPQAPLNPWPQSPSQYTKSTNTNKVCHIGSLLHTQHAYAPNSANPPIRLERFQSLHKPNDPLAHAPPDPRRRLKQLLLPRLHPLPAQPKTPLSPLDHALRRHLWLCGFPDPAEGGCQDDCGRAEEQCEEGSEGKGTADGC